MYDDHHGFTGRPFQLIPDPRCWFATTAHRQAMSYLGYGLSQGEGFIVITGDVGTGKTTLVRQLLARIDPEQLYAIPVAATRRTPDDLLQVVAVGLDVAQPGAVAVDVLAAIERGLHTVARSGRRTLLIVDEAQALPPAALEALRMLSHISAGGHAMLQIFLLGRPEFRDLLAGPGRLAQLRQRVIALHHLEPMAAEEVEPYLAHRLALVGWNGTPRFTAAAFAALHSGSGGVPRLLNQLAGRVLLDGAIKRIDAIDADLVTAALAGIARELPQLSAGLAPAAPVAMAAAPVEGDVAALGARIVKLEGQVAEAAVTRPEIAELAAHVATLDTRIEDQDATLRRVLTLLVDWVEAGKRPSASPVGGRRS